MSAPAVSLSPRAIPGHSYRRWPAPARLAAYLAACLLLSAGWCAVLMGVGHAGPEAFVHPERYPAIANAYLAGSYAILMGGAAWAWRRLQGEGWHALGLGGRPGRELLEGALWGLGSLGLLFALELAGGALLWDRSAWARTPAELIALNALSALFFGLSEEALFRGFVLQTLRRGLGSARALVASAAFYATVHFLRFDLSWHQFWPPWLGLFGAGLLLGALALRNRAIWQSAGLHAAWVYLFVLSDRQKLLVYPEGFNWLTGGGYPLAGLGAMSLLALLGWGLARRADSRDNRSLN